MDDIRKTLTTQRLIYWAPTVMLILLAASVYALIYFGQLGKPDYSLAEMLQTILLVLVPLAIGASYFLFKAMLSRIDKKLPLAQRLQKYFSIVLVRSAILEAPGLFSCVAAFITRDELFLAAVPIILFVFTFLRPMSTTISEDLQLSSSERNKLATNE